MATGLGLTGGRSRPAARISIDTTVVPQLGAANTFTGNQTVTGNVIATGYEIPFAGTNYLFDSGSPFTGAGLGNSYLGFAGNAKTTGQGNVAAGWAALLANTTGLYNTAVGVSSLFTNSSGQQNTAVGYDALFATGGGSSATANNNTAIGFAAAYSNNTGYNNTAIGIQAMYDNTGGIGNTALGGLALYTNTTGNYNTAVGYQAGPTGALTNSTAIGANALVSESNALVLGGTGANAVKVGIGTASPAYTLDAAGTIRSSTGGFMFPDGTTQTTAATGGGGGGTVTSVATGLGLKGGTITTTGTLTIDTTVIPQLSAANTFTGNIVAGTSSSSSFGVLGESNAASGQTYGVGGLAVSPAGYGIWGVNAASGGIGVYGFDSGGTGVSGGGAAYGVYGTATGDGVYGTGSLGARPRHGGRGRQWNNRRRPRHRNGGRFHGRVRKCSAIWSPGLCHGKWQHGWRIWQRGRRRVREPARLQRRLRHRTQWRATARTHWRVRHRIDRRRLRHRTHWRLRRRHNRRRLCHRKQRRDRNLRLRRQQRWLWGKLPGRRQRGSRSLWDRRQRRRRSTEQAVLAEFAGGQAGGGQAGDVGADVDGAYGFDFGGDGVVGTGATHREAQAMAGTSTATST